MTKDFGAMIKSIVNQKPGQYTVCDMNTKGIKTIETQTNENGLYDLWIKTKAKDYYSHDLPVSDVLRAFISVCKHQIIPAFVQN